MTEDNNAPISLHSVRKSTLKEGLKIIHVSSPVEFNPKLETLKAQYSNIPMDVLFKDETDD